MMDAMQSVTDRVLDHVDRRSPGGVIGVYLCGSSVAGGLRHESDIDLLLITRRSLLMPERHDITELLLQYSGSRAMVEPGRPVELTSIVHSALTPWKYPPTRDYQYGEWLRGEIIDGLLPTPCADPDLAILIASARSASEELRGPSLREVADAVPMDDIRCAIRDSLDGLLGGFDGDERNVLLTLARMIATLDSGEIVPKDQAALSVTCILPSPCNSVLDLARRAYLGEVADDWTRLREQARQTVKELEAQIRCRL